ncbi:hypothetical protein HAZT_HAZT011175 [Hyalella azteca]|uniref:Chitin-binding type-2 domain-containing protein n=1 Tax=Hyalella azteca TaxID=294128 RepID=A0A6A0GX02_HYAAZ|nr:hypothetical protein HAZT_HAZT011175 [Hyalella azteca]
MNMFCTAAADDPCAPDCAPGDDGLYPHPQDCTEYYQCANGNAIIQHCPGGLEYNPTAGVCDFPASAGCTADPDFDCGGGEVSTTTSAPSTTAPAESTTEVHSTTMETISTEETTTDKKTTTEEIVSTSSYTPELTTESLTTTQEVSYTTTEILSSLNPSTDVPLDCFPSCPSSSAIYANPRDCDTYFMCFGGVPYLMTCSPGQEYNPETEFCEDAGTFECTAGPDQPCIAVTNPPKF